MTRTLRSWLPFLLWALLIFALVPYATELQRAITARLGNATFRWLVAAILGSGGLAAVGWLVWRRPSRLLARLGWVVGIVGVALIWSWQLRGKAEALHWLEYGALSLLAFHALRPRLRDAGIFLVAAAATALVGTVDELVQGLVPGRFFDLADIVMNASIGVMTQLLIARGWCPAGLAPTPSRRSWVWLLRLLIIQALLLLVCVSSTPARVAGWARPLPFLAYLGDEASTRLVEYGYRYEDPEHGTFRSRLSPTELTRIDAERGAEVAALLDRHVATSFGEFTTLFSPGRDPFVFEIRSHLFFRDRHRAKAAEAKTDSERRRHLTQALGEQLILERYFGRTLGHSKQDLSPDERARIASQAELGPTFESQVDRDLITAWSERQAHWALGILMLALVASERLLSRTPKRATR